MNTLAFLAIGGGALLLLSSRKSANSRQGSQAGESPGSKFLLACVGSSGGTYKIKHPSDPPADQLVQTQVPGSSTKSRPLRRDAAAAYLAMVAAARADGIPAPYLELLSGYRDASNQAGIRSKAEARTRAEHPDWSAAQVSESVNAYVAKPGQSAHQHGVAVDLNMGYAYLAVNKDKMQATAAFKWMQKNAVRYGFYNYPVEPWHWAYNPPCRGARTEGDAREYPGRNVKGVRGLGRFVPVVGRWRGR